MRMLKRIRARRVVFLASASFLVLASSGCSFFAAGPSGGTQLVKQGADGPSYTVEYHPHKRRGWQKKFPMSGPTYVTGALEQAGAMKKLGDMNVSVIRNVEGSNRTVAMAVTRKGRGVSPNTDYALHDGDRIVIKEDVSSPVDKLLDFLPASY